MPTPRIPVELIERIIRNLSDDPPSLLACSLVAKGWHARSRVFIFRQVDLKSMPQIKRLLRSLDGDKALESLIDTVVVWIVPDPFGRSAQRPSVLTVLDPLPTLLLRRLPNLEHLDFRHYGVRNRDYGVDGKKNHVSLIHSFLLRPSLVRNLRRCAPIRHLSIGSVTFKTHSDFFNLVVNAFPALERLACFFVCVLHKAASHIPQRWLSMKLALKELHIDDCDANITRILVLMSQSTLQSLVLRLVITDEWLEGVCPDTARPVTVL
ncbi:hypothetical protein C8Q76DRAFT_758508 [Earliella scabrosa]|nr:hypothetical protein C8Q76DRAFT_758508 [Earliella scabrosa]